METHEEKSYDPADHYGGIRSNSNGRKYNRRKHSRLIESIKESPEYKEFRKQSDILRVDSDLKHRVDAFRGENYRIQNECDADSLFDVVEQISKESAQLRSNPQVNAYLDAELALCRMMQKISMELTDGIDLDAPFTV